MKNAGIYVLTCKVNGKQYVGKGHKLPQEARLKLAGKRPKCRLIHRAIQKYGAENFDLELIPYPNISKEALVAVERWKIKQYGSLAKNGYNLKDGDERGLVSDETRQRMSESSAMKRPEVRQKISQSLTGRKLPEAHKEKLRGRKHSPEWKQERSEASKGEKNHFYGKKHSEESKRLMSVNNSMHRPECRKRSSEAHKGQKVSAEARRKISEKLRHPCWEHADEIVRLHKTGEYSMRKLGRIYGCGHKVISKILKAHYE